MNIDFSQHRVNMVDSQLRTTDVTSQPLLEAMAVVPREAFVDAGRQPLAYIDEDIIVMSGGVDGRTRYLMEPSPFARLVQLAGVRPGDVVLDIGCATGYSSAILSLLAGSVIALECDETLARRATVLLESLSYANVAVVQGKLQEGYPSEAPYDVIVIEGAVDKVPDALFKQLKEGGRLVAVEGLGNAGVAMLYVKDNGLVAGRRDFNAAVKPLPGFEKVLSFSF